MSKMSKTIAALGVVAGLGVAALPLSSYADDYSQSTQAKVQAEVGGAISIAVDSGNANDNTLVDLGQLMVNGDVKTSSVDVIVSTNNTKVGEQGIGYTLTMSMVGDNNSLNNGNGATIPAGTPEKGTSAWGYTQSTITDADSIAAATWKKVPAGTASDPAVALTTTTGKIPTATEADGVVTAGKETTKVTFGASADGSQQEGIYTGSVIFTATVQN